MELKIQQKALPQNIVKLELTGEVSAATMRELQALVRKLAADGKKYFLIDLAEVSVLTHDGAKALLLIRADVCEQDGNLVITNASGAIGRRLELLGIRSVLELGDEATRLERLQYGEVLHAVLSHARCILWDAVVTDRGEWFDWDMRIHCSELIRQEFNIYRKKDEPEQRMWLRFISADPDQVRRMDETSRTAMRSNTGGYSQEFWIRAADGSQRWLQEYVRVTPMGKGEWNLISVVVDVTERKRLEQDLVYERDLLHILMSNIPDRIYFKDVAGRFRRVNHAVARRMGIKRAEDAVGKTDFDFYPVANARRHRAEEEQILRTGQAMCDKLEGGPVFGGKWTSVTKVPIKDKDGKPIGIVGINRDITERHRLEQALAEERLLLRQLIDAIPDYLYVKDAQSRFVVANARCASHAGFARAEEMAGKSDFDTLPRPLAERFFAEEQAMLKSGQAIIKQEQMVGTDPKAPAWLCVTKIPLRDQTGRIIGLVGSGIDITRQKRQEQELAEANSRLQALVSHDSLTGLLNRRMVMEAAQREWERWKRYKTVFSLALIDIAGFRELNKRLGHQAGDRVLKMTALAIGTVTRSADCLGRYGGDEFLLIMPATTEAGASSAVKKLQAVFNTPFALDNQDVQINNVVGFATVVDVDHSIEDVIARAEKSAVKTSRVSRRIRR